jgi:3'-phosphoadenosine 5'-phosphosulfate sulfotransferase (PAPS reductase)/FAD synthetase
VNNPTLFDDLRMTLKEAIDLTVASILAYAPRYQHWAIAYSGGKDSTATVTQIAHPRSKNLCTACLQDARSLVKQPAQSVREWRQAA